MYFSAAAMWPESQNRRYVRATSASGSPRRTWLQSITRQSPFGVMITFVGLKSPWQSAFPRGKLWSFMCRS